MINQNLRKRIGEEGYINSCFYDCQSYDNSIIGVDVNGKIVYVYNYMIDEYIKDEYPNLNSENAIEQEDAYISAIEWIDVNTMRATPYMSSLGIPPVIIDYNPEDDSIYNVISGEVYNIDDIVFKVEDKFNEFLDDLNDYKQI